MSILGRHLAAQYARTSLASMAGLVALFLVVDYVDRAKYYTGRAWFRWVVELYAWKSVLVAYELAPAALLLGAGVLFALLRRRGELTAMRALAVGPARMVAPLVAVAVLAIGGLVVADELLLGPASVRVDEIAAGRFRMPADWRKYFGQKEWFRGKQHIYRLRTPGERGFHNVTIYSLDEAFRLSERVDAREMQPLEGRRWRLLDGTRRTLDGERTRLEQFEEKVMELDEDASSFRIVAGRPEQMRLRQLREQRALRERVGLPAARYTFALHNKLAYPLGALPAMLVACALGLRRGRRGTVAAAIAEGFLLIILLWMAMVIGKAGALAGGINPALGAWLPALAFGAAAAVTLRRAAA